MTDEKLNENIQITERNEALKKTALAKYGERGLRLAEDILRYDKEVEVSEFWKRFETHI